MTTKRHPGVPVSITLASVAGCAADEPDDGSNMETFTDEELAARPLHDEVTADTVPIAERPEITREAYTPWVWIGNASGGMSVRYCKTSTRLNWEFQNWNASRVVTDGTNMSAISTNIAGVSSGSKYRTHNNSAYVSWAVYHPTAATLYGVPLSSVPGC